MIPPLRARVIAALEVAGFRSSEHHLPVYSGGGCFSAIGSDRTGINVTALRWDATPAELAELLARDGYRKSYLSLYSTQIVMINVN
jgi:hypothetical protein